MRSNRLLALAALAGLSVTAGFPHLAAKPPMRQNCISGESSGPSQAAAGLRTAIASINPQ